MYPTSTPLIDAIKADDLDQTIKLIQDGVDIHEVAINNNSAIHVAASSGNSAITKLLLDTKADPNCKSISSSGFWTTPLIYAIRNNDLEISKLLLEYGADPNMSDGVWNIPLTMAIRIKHIDIVKLLLQFGADTSLSSNKHIYWTNPLMICAINSLHECIGLLLSYGAPMKVYDPAIGPISLLQYAVNACNYDATLYLLNLGFSKHDIKCPDNYDNIRTLLNEFPSVLSLQRLCLNIVVLNRLDTSNIPPLLLSTVE